MFSVFKSRLFSCFSSKPKITRETRIIPDLPPDLVEEILSRVPAKSLKQLRCTCKRWNNLFKDERFAIKHFGKEARQPMVLMLKDFRVCSMGVDLYEIHNKIAAPGLGLKDSEQVSTIFHCHGLLLCTTKDNRLVVWNPFNGQTRWIRPSNTDQKYSRFALGYQNNKSCHNYKLLRCWNNYNPNHRVVEYEIYEFSSDSWRVLDDANPCFTIESSGVYLKGNTYWCAFDEKEEEQLVLSFDFSTERFTCLCLPFASSEFYALALSVVREEQLSVICERLDKSKIEIWVTTNDNIDQTKVLSWRNFLVVAVCWFSSGISFIINEEKKVAVCCNRGRGETSRNMVYIIGEVDEYYREIPFGESTDKICRPFIFSYVPSLVQIEQSTVQLIPRQKKKSEFSRFKIRT